MTKFARLEFELFTKPSKLDFLRVHQGLVSVDHIIFYILLKTPMMVNRLW